MKSIEIKKKQIEVASDGKSVCVHSPELATILVQARTFTVKKLRDKVGKIDLKEISFDSKGRIVFSNSSFVEKIKTKLKESTADDTNILCNMGCSSNINDHIESIL
jgi:hypothetical protein